ncbi:MAG: DUF2061 domain-containing protein [Phycisphaerae bacterium]|nr:DUF2061 domain-containing protein [Phycisphaerae bacterium]
MDQAAFLELKRRTIVKSLIWRVIGIVWTWIGAYFILVHMPEKFRTATLMAIAIAVYHHSTRIIMYYIYERIWSRILWGRVSKDKLETVAISAKTKLLWIIIVTLSLVLIFFLILYVTPMMKK